MKKLKKILEFLDTILVLVASIVCIIDIITGDWLYTFLVSLLCVIYIETYLGKDFTSKIFSTTWVVVILNIIIIYVSSKILITHWIPTIHWAWEITTPCIALTVWHILRRNNIKHI